MMTKEQIKQFSEMYDKVNQGTEQPDFVIFNGKCYQRNKDGTVTESELPEEPSGNMFG